MGPGRAVAMASQNERVYARVGTRDGHCLDVCCSSHTVALRRPGKLFDEFVGLNSIQARELGEALIAVSKAIGG
jgi:hypothetical protein